MDIKQICGPILRKAGVKRSAVFGSVARGEARNGSDVDILVEFRPGASLYNLMSLEDQLQTALKRDVDVITYGALVPSMRKRILAEAIAIL